MFRHDFAHVHTCAHLRTYILFVIFTTQSGWANCVRTNLVFHVLEELLASLKGKKSDTMLTPPLAAVLRRMVPWYQRM